MIGRICNPTCAKCGRLVPDGAGFCPNCGTQLGDSSFAPTFASNDASVGKPFTSDDPVTALPPRAGEPDSTRLPQAEANAVTGVGGAPVADAPPMSPTGMVTSLASPSPHPVVQSGDGPFQAGQQVGPRYTIIRLLGIGGMGAVYQAFDHELGVAVAIKVIRPGAQSDAIDVRSMSCPARPRKPTTTDPAEQSAGPYGEPPKPPAGPTTVTPAATVNVKAFSVDPTCRSELSYASIHQV